MGSLIIRQVIADLIPLGLGHSQGADLLIAGSSAGGLGVVLNLDKIKKFLQEEKGLLPISQIIHRNSNLFFIVQDWMLMFVEWVIPVGS